ncbi:MAG: FAD-binding oxidoreductase [Acidimicrobiales bacterium]|nr:FAD-binding oxidoreductase [Acidimicrobiales bacterium]MDG2219246.1 FAD-binding oxidoreductase [Acidimicrobiales bacterium]
MPKADAAFVDLLRAELGEVAIVTGSDADDQTIDAYGKPTAIDSVIVRPANVNEVSFTVKACADAGIAIVSQGGNTGLSKGTYLPEHQPSIILSLARLNQIESIDPERWTITAQAGVTIQAVQEAAAGVGRLFAPDWGARGSASVGGAVATDAGGNNVVRYGNMRDNVMGIQAVLADGSIWDGRRSLRKDSSGYDLKHLFIGSEGTLGVVTSAVLKLVPATPYATSTLAAITGLDALMPLLTLAQKHGAGTLTAFELIPDVAMARVDELFGRGKPIDAGTEFSVLVKLASSEPVDDMIASFLSSGVEAGYIVDAIVAGTPDQEASLWTLRDDIPPSTTYRETQHHGIKLDTAVPIDHIEEFIRRITASAEQIAPMALCYGFGHIGDGNIHMMILPITEETIEPWLEVKPAMEAAIDETVFDLDGTLSAEHGVGLLLRDRVGPQKQKLEWDMMRSVQRALDPDNVFNPGKLIPDPAS